MKKYLLAIVINVIFFGLHTNALAVVPTFDAAALAKMIDQLKQGQLLLEQLKGQINEMKRLYGSLNGVTDLSILQEFFDKIGKNSTLPSDFNHFEQSIEGTSNGNNENTKKWEDKLLYKEPPSGAESKAAVDAFYRQKVEKLHKNNVGQAALDESIYNDTNEIKKTIRKLSAKLKNAKTAAQVQDIQTQLSTVQAELQAQLLQMQATAMVQQAARKSCTNPRTREEFNARYRNYAKQLLGN
ncbi:type IV secretion system protein [Bartonella sp. B30(2025)]